MAYTIPSINENCHIIMQHPEVNDGNNCGFILHTFPIKESPSVIVELHRDSDLLPYLHITATIEISDKLRSPNGSVCPWTSVEMMLLIFDLLDQDDGQLLLLCSAGAFTSLLPVGPNVYSMEALPDKYLITINLYRNYRYFMPAPERDFLASVWDGIKTWESSWWR